jgi:hypothetical protein
MDLWMIAEIVGGAIVGLFLGPLIYILAGFVAYLVSEKKIDARIENERREHSYVIAKQKKRYEKANTRYMKTKLKVEKFIERKSRVKTTDEPEQEVQE